MNNPVLVDKIARIIYRLPNPPSRIRTKPMEVLCVGFPRTGTESLQTALLKLGYDYTYHGWDILFEDPPRLLGWSRLCRKKWHGEPDGDVQISAAEFDELIGHAVAVTDAVGSCFAAELIAAYPDAKVVLNVRRDLDAWHRSAVKTLLDEVERSWVVWLLKWFSAQGFWMVHIYFNFLWRRLFRSPGRTVESGLLPNGKWIQREHWAMVRGMVPQDHLLEWAVEDGWEPLCKFLGKEVPNEVFPRTNSPEAYKKRIDSLIRSILVSALGNIAVIGVLLYAIAFQAVPRWLGK